MKGQNLRLFINGHAVASEKSCQVNLKTQTEDVSTKDTKDDYNVIDVVSKSADISCDSLYVPGNFFNPLNRTTKQYSGYAVFTEEAYTLHAGDHVSVYSLNGREYDVAIFKDGATPTLVHSFKGIDRQVYSVFSAAGDDFVFGIKNVIHLDAVGIAISNGNGNNSFEEIYTAYTNKETVEASLSLCSRASAGIVKNDDIVKFSGIITDLNITAADRQYATTQLQMQAQLVE